MITLSLFLSQGTTNAHATHNQIVLIAGSLRTTTQNMVVKISSGDAGEQEFADHMQTFSLELDRLIDYGSTGGNPFADALIYPSILYPEYSTDVNDIRITWLEFVSIWERLQLLSPDDPELADQRLNATSALASLLAKVDGFAVVLDTLDDLQDKNQGRIQIGFLAAGLLLLGSGGYVVGVRIIRPITYLDSAVRGMALGSQSVAIDINSSDEIGRLARTFETMRTEISAAQHLLEEKVEERTAVLTTVFEFSQEIVSQPNEETLIRSIVQRAREVMRSEVVNLCLIHPVDQQLQLVSGVDRNGQRFTPVNIGQIQNSPDVRTQLEKMCAAHGLSVPNLCCSAALYDGEQSIGAICVQCSSGRPFTEVDRRTLTLLANSAAVAISNGRLMENSRKQAALNATLTERQRLTSELHDEAAQTMNLLSLKVGELDDRLPPGEKERTIPELDEIKKLIDRTQAQMRMAFSGMSAVLTNKENHISRDLRNFLAEFSSTSGIRVDLTLDDTSSLELPQILQKQVMYIFREALTNVKRYANVKKVEVQFRYVNNSLHLEVNDEGRGFDPSLARSDHHLGLSVMQARTERIGGILEIETAPGAGTRVIADIPIKPAGV